MRDRPSLKPSHCSLRAVALVGEAGNLPRQAIEHSAHVGFSAVRIDLQHAIATLPQPATALVARALSRLVFGLGREIDDRAQPKRYEIGDIDADRHLAFEAQPGE